LLNVVIVAGTFQEARSFASLYKLPKTRWTWLWEVPQLKGRHPSDTLVFCVGSWQETSLGRHPRFARFLRDSRTSMEMSAYLKRHDE
jgi:hypothetical protein